MKNKRTKKEKKDKKPFVLIDKAIDNLKDDYIGVSNYVDTLHEAIKQGARMISINSKYGGGKSSVCNILKKSKKYNKKSVISLWDVTIEQSKNPNESNNSDIISFYKSFLFKLSSDYYSEKYSRYVSKALNKTTGVINVFFKTRCITFWFVVSCICFAIYFLFNGICCVNWKFMQSVFDFLNIKANINFYRYLFLIIGSSLLLFTIFKGRVVYTSWKAECNRLLTIDDVTSIYAGLISDAICNIHFRKNIIIIDDIDRCIDENKSEAVIGFIKSIIKLLDFNCKPWWLRGKLKSIVLIICIDEEKVKGTNDDESLLKLFDYRLDIGTIHYEDFKGILEHYSEKNEKIKEHMDSLMLLLNNKNNNIRLLKKEINDAFVKYETLKSRFSKVSDKIRFEPCVVYSYLKNNYPNGFQSLINNSIETTRNIRKAIEQYSTTREITTEEIISKINNENKNEKQEFNNKIKEFIKLGYINEDFKLYFYNYPKGEKCRNTYETIFWDSLKGLETYDTINNTFVSADYILECASDVNRIKMKYPIDILSDKYVLSVLIMNNNDIQLLELLSDLMKFNDDEKIKKSTSFMNFLSDNQIDYKYMKIYLEKINYVQWERVKISNFDLFYEFRKALVKYVKDDIVLYKQLFQGNLNSICKDEYMYITQKRNTTVLINNLKFNSDVEDILLDLYDILDIKQKLDFCKLWKGNIIEKENYIQFSIDVLSEYLEYENEILKSFENYYDDLQNNIKFATYLNKIISGATKETLVNIDTHNIYFGFDNESLKYFITNGIIKTPLLYLLKQRRFDEIVELSVEFKNIFDILLHTKDKNYHDDIRSFKEFIIYKTQSSKFNYLFLDHKFVTSYGIEIDWRKVENINLLVSCNLNNIQVVNENIENKEVIYTEEKIIMLLTCIKENMTQYIYSNSDILIELLKIYPDQCKNISRDNSILVDFINYLNGTNKLKTIIKYMIYCDTLLPQFYSILRQYDNINDKTEYADYVNTLSYTRLSLELIESVNIDYPYNDGILSILRENKRFYSVLSSYLIKGEIYKMREEMKELNSNEILNLWNLSDKYKLQLLKNKHFLERFKFYNFIEKIDNTYILKLIKDEKEFSTSVIKNILTNSSSLKVQSILLSIECIADKYVSNFLKILYDDTEILKLIREDENIKVHLYNCVGSNYKGIITRKFY